VAVHESSSPKMWQGGSAKPVNCLLSGEVILLMDNTLKRWLLGELGGYTVGGLPVLSFRIVALATWNRSI